MNAAEKLKAKANHKAAPSPQDKGKIKKKPMSKGTLALIEGKAHGDFLNPKELAIAEYLMEHEAGTLKDFIPIMMKHGAAGVYTNKASASKGEEIAYRWAQNSIRKLYKIGVCARVAPGTYEVHPNRTTRIIRETREWMCASEIDHTAAAVQEYLGASGDFPTKAAVARHLHIKPRRWGSLVAGSQITEHEQKIINGAMRDV